MMTGIFLSFLGISISISLMIALLLLLAPFLNKRYAAKWKYWIWIVLALRLIIPLGGDEGDSAVNMQSQVEMQTASEVEETPSDMLVGGTARRRVVVEIPTQLTTPIAMRTEKADSNISMLDLIAFVWMLGGLLFMSVHLISYFHYKRQVLQKGKIVNDHDVLCLLLKLKHELHIKCTVSVIEYSGAASPMMIGFFHHILVLPEEQYQIGEEYSREELFFIFKHELIHLKRGDIYFKLLFAAANAVHWFNPLIWIMQKEAAVDMELSCDERVTQGADYATRKAYTETLLSTLHKQSIKKTVISTQFYGGKQIMKKRFKNILTKRRKKNGAILLVFAVALTVSLGTLAGCSIGNENAEDLSEQAENGGQSEVVDSGLSGENGMEDELSTQEIPSADIPDEEAVAENTMILTFMKEGELEEKQATLVTTHFLQYGYSFYLPDGEWQKEEADMWRAVENEDVHLWVAHFEEDYHIDAERLFVDDGYEHEDGELVKQEEGIIYKVRLYEDGGDVWCVSYCYPMEAEEGWGRELPVIADTFAVIAPVDIIDGYITMFDKGSVTIDRQLWVTYASEDWKPEYNADAGFEVVDVEGGDITYPLHADCTFVILENHYDPAIEISRDEFADYLTEMEYPVLWIFELEDGQVRSIVEQYLP